MPLSRKFFQVTKRKAKLILLGILTFKKGIELMKIKTIDITALEWFDKVNGNSYFSATVTLNFGMKDQKILPCLFNTVMEINISIPPQKN
jgi:hypothetical protein